MVSGQTEGGGFVKAASGAGMRPPQLSLRTFLLSEAVLLLLLLMVIAELLFPLLRFPLRSRLLRMHLRLLYLWLRLLHLLYLWMRLLHLQLLYLWLRLRLLHLRLLGNWTFIVSIVNLATAPKTPPAGHTVAERRRFGARFGN